MSSIISRIVADAHLKMTFCRHMGLNVRTVRILTICGILSFALGVSNFI